MDGYLNEHFHIPAKNPPSEARLRWRRAVGRVVLNSRRRFREFSALGAVDNAQRRKILVRSFTPPPHHSLVPSTSIVRSSRTTVRAVAFAEP
jgi:hypothetical protein